MARHVDKISALVEQRRGMGSTLDDPLITGILIASINVEELKPPTMGLETLSDEKIKWADVTARLLEEVKSLKSERNQSSRQAMHDEQSCGICCKTNHHTGSCFLNQRNRFNKVGLFESLIKTTTNNNSTEVPSKSVENRKSKKKN